MVEQFKDLNIAPRYLKQLEINSLNGQHHKKIEKKSQLSTGAKKDMLVANFAFGLLSTSYEDVAKKDQHIVSRDNTTYKVNKRVDRRIESMIKRLQETQDSIYRKYEDRDRSVGKWVKSKLQRNFQRTIKSIGSHVSLEMIAHQVLYVNFCERDKPLIEEFNWLTNSKQYDDLYDLLEQTNAANGDDPFETAHRVIKLITE